MTARTPSLMPSATEPPSASPPLQLTRRVLWQELAPICALVFLEFLAMGLPLAVLPVHIHDALGFGSFAVGVAVGAQSWATLLTRHSAGRRADRDGPRTATLLGLLLSALAGTT